MVLGLILTGIMFRKNPATFKIKNIRNILWMMASFAATYIPTLGLALLNWQQPNWKILAVCILYTVRVSCLIFEKIQPDTRYSDFVKWATMPDCLKKVLKIPVEAGHPAMNRKWYPARDSNP